jgi:peptide chain release factor subunit 3
MTPFIKTTGFSSKMVTYVPVSAFTGANLKEAAKKEVCPWYT